MPSLTAVYLDPVRLSKPSHVPRQPSAETITNKVTGYTIDATQPWRSAHRKPPFGAIAKQLSFVKADERSIEISYADVSLVLVSETRPLVAISNEATQVHPPLG